MAPINTSPCLTRRQRVALQAIADCTGEIMSDSQGVFAMHREAEPFEQVDIAGDMLGRVLDFIEAGSPDEALSLIHHAAAMVTMAAAELSRQTKIHPLGRYRIGTPAANTDA